MENREIITINIEEGIKTKAFNTRNIIHIDAFKRIKKIIDKNLQEAINYHPQQKEDLIRVHNTITINGERGAGKTSFMLSIKKEYESCNEIEVLDILDPTLISTRQHVFILLISMIEEKVNKKFNDRCREKKYDDKYKKWKQSLEELAKGLNQLDGIGTNPYTQDLWDDSALVMAKGLSLAKAGRDLEWKFHKFVNKSLEILNKKAFLLFIDDIDTDFSKGWDILEVLRKYITTPQIIPIMAGNFELYENLVRNEKSKLFKDLISFEKNFNSFENKKILYNKQIDELTQQYLIKVLQPINTVNLHKLSYLISKEKKFSVKFNNKIIDKDLINLITKIFKKHYKIFIDEYKETILKLPLRTFFQWLYFAQIYNKRNDKFIEIHKDIFFSNFVNYGINNESLELLIDKKYNFDEFIRQFIKNLSFDELKDFKTQSLDLNLNIILMTIPQFLNLTSSLAHKLNFGIKVSLVFYIKHISNFYQSLLFHDKTSILYYLQVDKHFNTSSRIKNIFEIIYIYFLKNNSYKIKIIQKIYAEKSKIGLYTFYIFIKRKNLIMDQNILEQLKKNVNINPIRNIYTKENTLENFIKNNKNNTKLQEIYKNNLIDFIEILKNGNIWNKIPFFNVKNIEDSIINVYLSPIKIIGLFIEILEILESKKTYLIKEILLKYINEKIWSITSFDNPIQTIEIKENIHKEINQKEINIAINELKQWYKEFKNIIEEFIDEFHIIKSSEFYYNFYKKIEAIKINSYSTAKEYIQLTLSIYINELIKLLKNDLIKDIVSYENIKNLSQNFDKLNEKQKKYIKIFTKCPIFKAYLENDDSLLDKILLVKG